ncbi:MAG TPA: CapA family protein [Thermoleophilia bacterium]|nr:CapA family protein [Thermoleophilia bacterium]
MSPSRRRADVQIYRSAGYYEHQRRRRRALLAAAVVAVVVLAVAAGAFAYVHHTRGGPSAVADTGSSGGGGTAGATPTAPATSTSSMSPSASPSPSPRTLVTIGWAGDTTPGSMYGDPPDDGRALFTHVRGQLKKPDLMMVNLEGTYSTGGVSKCSGSSSGVCFAFQAPPSFASALPWAGIDLVNQANNHANDYFGSGMQQTQAALEKNDIAFTGLPDQITVVTVKGVKVAVLGFSPYPWNADINDIPAASRLVRKAAARADVVVVLMHVGAEGSDKTHTPHGTEYAFGENRGDPRAFAHAVVDAGADLVLGSGPHVIRGIERYRTRLIAYSLGDFAGWGNFGTGGTLSLSGLLTVRIDSGGHIHGGRWLSLWLASPGVPTVDSSNASAHLVEQLSSADFANTFEMDSSGHLSVR